MKRSLVITTLLLAHYIVWGQIPADSIKAILKQEVAAKRSKSMVIGVIDAGGRQIYSEGIMSNEKPVRPDGNTVYEIGSITKVFASVLLAKMNLENQLNLTDPISKYLPSSVKSPVRNGREITLLSLSTHRTGMPRFPYHPYPKDIDNPYADYTEKALFDYVSGFQPEYDFDTRWRYSNVAYGLLGNILSRIAKKDFESMTLAMICRPLKMTATAIRSSRQMKANTAKGHAITGQPTVSLELGALEAAGALRSTANDLLTFAAANMGLTKTDLLPALQLTHVLRAKKDGNDTYTTMGWTLANDSGRELLFKDGGTPGYRTFLGFDKEKKIGVVVLSNTDNSVTDIGWHILDPNHKVEPYRYPWTLLDTLRSTAQTRGADAAIKLHDQLNNENNAAFQFNEQQLDYLGHELRRSGKIEDAIKIFEHNAKVYPKATIVYVSLGEIHRRTGTSELAAIYFEKALALEPQNEHLKRMVSSVKKRKNK
ncbi:serine hydrolase [Flavisolibacter sp. BT320]|nr:serine hydrolase [Flavisolibacter longurius]